jgi:hypothetical protein
MRSGMDASTPTGTHEYHDDLRNEGGLISVGGAFADAGSR